MTFKMHARASFGVTALTLLFVVSNKNICLPASMSAKLRECRQGLAAALDQATGEHCSPVLPNNISGSLLYVSFPNNQSEILHDRSLCLMPHNETFGHPMERSVCRQESSSQFWSEADLPQDLPGLLETSSMQTLEELVAKLEFENELNRVCMTLNTQSLPSARGHSTGSADSGVEEGASEEDGEEDEQEILLDTVLEMEQDYDIYY